MNNTNYQVGNIGDNQPADSLASEALKWYPSSIIMRRWVAFLIDTALMVLLVVMHFMSIGKASVSTAADTVQAYSSVESITFYMILLVIIIYYPLLEGLRGFTVGKLLLGVRVVDKDCKVPGLLKGIIRSLLRLIEFNPLLAGGLPAGLTATFSKDKQRIGDMAAKTYVVKTYDCKFIKNKTNNIISYCFLVLCALVLIADLIFYYAL